MRIRHRETYKRMLRWLVSQHDDGVPWVDTETIYQWWNRQTKQGCTMGQLVNYLGKGKEIDKSPDKVYIAHPGLMYGAGYMVCLWRVHPHYIRQWRAKRETKNDEC